MKRIQSYACEICGIEKNDHDRAWFLLTEDHWQDTLNILKWEPQLAQQAGMHFLCSARHVQQLVCEWMMTGTISCPADALPSVERSTSQLPCNLDPDLAAARLGELMVDRESMNGLRAQPEMLMSILDAIDTVLESAESAQEKEDELICDA